MDNSVLGLAPMVWLTIWFGAAAVVVFYVVFVRRRDAAGKSYGPDTAMGIGLSDVGRGGGGIGPGDAGGGGSST